jgi:hypothetical protein
VLLGGGNSVNYTPQGAAVAIDSGLGVGDWASSTLAGATVAISAGFLAGNILSFTNQNGVAGSYNAGTGVLTLTGSASLAGYQAALESVTFSSTSANPWNSGADLSRTVSWTVTEGTLSSNTITNTIDITAVPPVLSGGGNSVNYTPHGAAAAVNAGIGVNDLSSAMLAGATVTISAGFLAGDTLNFTNQNGITGTYNASTGVLTLTGSASLASYQAALASITFISTSGNPSDSGTDLSRTVSWTVTDGTLSSNTISSTIAITSVPPVLSGGGNSVTYAPHGAAVAVDAALGVNDAYTGTLAGATVAIGAGFLAGDMLVIPTPLANCLHGWQLRLRHFAAKEHIDEVL